MADLSFKSPEEIEKEAEGYSILTFADILRALKSHPDWLEEIRKIILTAELIELPRKFDQLARKVDKVEQDVEKLKQDVELLKQDVEILKQDVELLKKDMNYVKGELGRLKGSDFERRIKEKFYAYFGRLLRKSKLIEVKDLVSIFESAESSGKISEEQYTSLLEIDLIVEGELKETRKPVMLAVEVSYSIFEEDLSRAKERADLLSYLLGKEAIPVVVGVEAKPEIETLASEEGILLLKVKD